MRNNKRQLPAQSVEVCGRADMAFLVENSQVSFLDSTGKAVTQYSKAVSIGESKVTVQGKCHRHFYSNTTRNQ